MPTLGPLLVHEARVWRIVKGGAKDAQGERTSTPTPGPWFPARLTTRGQPADESAPDAGGRKRTERRWLLVWGDEDDTGAAIDAPTASDEVEVDTGDGLTVRYEVAGPALPYDLGHGVFGGQAVLVAVGEAR